MQRDLVIRARSGDHDAFSTLAAGAVDRLHRTAWLILRSDDDAADAVQESLLAAWLHIAAVRDPDRFDAWLNRLLSTGEADDSPQGPGDPHDRPG
jgi:RNA polymerase sigma-70 factor (ECF subfamily)